MPRRPFASAALALSALACAGKAPPATGAAGAATTPITTTRVVTGANTNLSLSAVNNPAASVKWVNATPKQVWDAVQAVYAELQIPVTDVIPAQMTIRNTGLKARRTFVGERMTRWFSCGGPRSMPNAETYEVHATLNTKIVPGKDGNGAEIVTLFEGIATPVQFSGAPVQCASTMELEKRIYTMAAQKLAS